MFFNNPWGYHIANGTMPSLDFDSIDDKDYLKKTNNSIIIYDF